MEYFLSNHPAFEFLNRKEYFMQKKFLIAGLSFAGLALILTLSSFFKPQSSSSEQPTPPDDISYQSNKKAHSTRNHLHLYSAFENDYYMNTDPKGFFYAELNAENMPDLRRQEVPLNLAIVIDRSGSMSGEKIVNARKAAKYIINQLGANDYVSIISYSSQVELVHATSRVQNQQNILSKIDRIISSGGTNLMGGAQRGYDEVKRNYKTGYINRVLLLSDGQANEGITDPTQIQKIVRNQNNIHGISISTFGLGLDYNEDLMTAMAEHGSGNYYFIRDAYGIAQVFERELNGYKELIAQNVQMEIRIPDNIQVEQVYGQSYEMEGRKIKVYIRDLFSKDRKGILVRYKNMEQSSRNINFITKVTFTDPSTEMPFDLKTSNELEFTNSRRLYLENFNEWVSTQVTLYESNEQLELAMREADKGNYEKAKQITVENKMYMQKKAPLVKKSEELQRAASNNESYDVKVESLQEMPAEEVKAVQKEYKSTNYQIRSKK